MTTRELSQLFYLNREIEQLTYRIEKIRARAQRVTTVLSDMPRSKNFIDFKDELCDLLDLLECKKRQCVIEQQRLERFINCIGDSQMRQILALRYINALSWQQVAFCIGEHDEQYPRRKHNRFLEIYKVDENDEQSVV